MDNAGLLGMVPGAQNRSELFALDEDYPYRYFDQHLRDYANAGLLAPESTIPQYILQGFRNMQSSPAYDFLDDLPAEPIPGPGVEPPVTTGPEPTPPPTPAPAPAQSGGGGGGGRPLFSLNEGHGARSAPNYGVWNMGPPTNNPNGQFGYRAGSLIGPSNAPVMGFSPRGAPQVMVNGRLMDDPNWPGR